MTSLSPNSRFGALFCILSCSVAMGCDGDGSEDATGGTGGSTSAGSPAGTGQSGATSGGGTTGTMGTGAGGGGGAPNVDCEEVPFVPPAGTAYYFADCQEGAAPTCVAGDDANDGTNPDAPRRTLDGIDVNTFPPGTQLYFARGGAWNDFHVVLEHPETTAEMPLVFDAYGEGEAPLLRSSFAIAFELGTYQSTLNDGGYVIRNFRLDGGGVSDWAFWFRDHVHDVLVEHVEVTGYLIGVHSQSAPGDGVRSITLRDLHVYENESMGMLGSLHDSTIECSVFTANNFSGSPFNHAIYLGGNGSNVTIRNNQFLENSTVDGVCHGGNITVHGQWSNVVMEGNLIRQTAATGGCYGFSLNPGYDTPEWMQDFTVRGNTVVNVGNCSVCASSTPGLLVENNLLINTQDTYHAAITLGGEPGPGDVADGGATIRNNTIVLPRAAGSSAGIDLRSTAGAGLTVASNLIWLGAEAGAGHRCYGHGDLSTFDVFANNLCHRAGAEGVWSEQYATLEAAIGAGFDGGGSSADPLFVELPSAENGWNDALQPASPAVDVGHPTASSTYDRLGVPRTIPDMGAREAR